MLLGLLKEQDKLRKQISKVLAELDYKIWLNVGFTGELKWTEHILTKS